jgi:hypothetical protein
VPAATDESRVRALVDDSTVNGPVVVNEDHVSDTASSTTLAEMKNTATRVFNAGGSWGLMWRPYNQFYPFRWAYGDPTAITTQAGWFHAVHDHVQDLTVP